MTSLNSSIEQVQSLFSEANSDAFSRLRVSNPVSLFDSTFQYNNQPLRWETFFSGAGSETTLPNYNATSSDILSIVCTCSSNATAWADISWVEQY